MIIWIDLRTHDRTSCMRSLLMHNLFEICYNNSKLALSKYIRTSQIYTCYKTRYWCIPNNCTACRVRRTLHMVLWSLENKDATVHTYF